MAKSTRKDHQTRSKSKSSSKTSSKTRSRGRSTTRRQEATPEATPEEEHKRDSVSDDSSSNSENEDEGPKRKRKRNTRATIVESLRNKKKRKGDGQRVNDLDAFKSAARLFSCTWSPYIDWSRALNTGLDRDEIIEAGCRNVAHKDPERSQVLKLYDKLVEVVPDAVDLLREVLENEALDELVTAMSLAASQSISNDVRELKSRILVWAKQFLHIDNYDPPISDDDKAGRGWHHPQIARLLCTPIKLPEFERDPKKFCARVHENSIRINHESFPACFYDDGGKKASEHKDFVCEHLLLSEILAKVWVDIFLGHANSAAFSETPNERFTVLKKGKAYRYGINQVTYRTIAYASVLMRHSLSASSDWRNDDGAVIKRDAFDAVIALFEDPELTQPDWNADLLSTWNRTIGWMLPNSDEITGLVSNDDHDSSLHMIRSLIRSKQAQMSRQSDDVSNGSSTGNITTTAP
ncbi:hypothetical protein K435DRAFT_876213 [Dendrothele bispora CBS 962.96]|uniref:Uncharacterized protein n=1 Tax=Dendrothele bispora (strain CBS 962.96) TaxID=1314807 RepID=A0A4S8KT19_DENBC|nr:hypothetical protein K435DRAFT_876213 [Dendrothele bispora CBS 962.96]